MRFEEEDRFAAILKCVVLEKAIRAEVTIYPYQIVELSSFALLVFGGVTIANIDRVAMICTRMAMR